MRRGKDRKVIKKKYSKPVWGHTPFIPATQEAEMGESFENSLCNIVRVCLKVDSSEWKDKRLVIVFEFYFGHF